VTLPIPLLIIPLGLFGLIVYFAVSKQSGLLIRWAAIIALILIGLSVVVCLFILFSEPNAVVVEGPNIDFTPDREVIPVKKSNPLPMLVFAGILLLFIALVVYLGLREQHRKNEAVKKAETSEEEKKEEKEKEKKEEKKDAKPLRN
jgi:amino acid transporter